MYCMTNLSLAWPTKISTLSKLLSPLVPHRSRQLLTGLAAKQARAEYAPPKGVRPRAALSVIVIGAGPVGLRTAIERLPRRRDLALTLPVWRMELGSLLEDVASAAVGPRDAEAALRWAAGWLGS